MNFEELWNKLSLELKTKKEFKTKTGLPYEAQIVRDRIYIYRNINGVAKTYSDSKKRIEKFFELFMKEVTFQRKVKKYEYRDLPSPISSYLLPIFKKYLTE